MQSSSIAFPNIQGYKIIDEVTKSNNYVTYNVHNISTNT